MTKVPGPSVVVQLAQLNGAPVRLMSGVTAVPGAGLTISDLAVPVVNAPTTGVIFE